MPNYTVSARRGERTLVKILDHEGSKTMPLRTAKGIAVKVGVHLDVPVIVADGSTGVEFWRYTGPAVEVADEAADG